MKKLFAPLFILAFAAPAFATSPAIDPLEESQIQWHTSKVTQLEILETLPVQYRLTYQASCKQTAVRKIKFRVGNELVVGVASRLNHALDCVDTAETVKLKKLTIKGDKSFNPESVKALKGNPSLQ